jgi:hypothetical protein
MRLPLIFVSRSTGGATRTSPSFGACLVLAGFAGLGAPAGLLAGPTRAEAEPASNERMAAPQAIRGLGIASYSLLPQEPGTRLQLYDADSRMVGTLQHRPPLPADEAAQRAASPETYVLSHRGEVLVLSLAGFRVEVQINDQAPVAFVFEPKSGRWSTDPAASDAVLEAAKPGLKIIGVLTEAVLSQRTAVGVPPGTDSPTVMRVRPPAAAEEVSSAADPPASTTTPPCTGSWLDSGTGHGTRSAACAVVTANVRNACYTASTGACADCCQWEDCNCACVSEDFICLCSRKGRHCSPGCPPEQFIPGFCSATECGVSCGEVARNKIPAGWIAIGGVCNFSRDCRCDAWLTTCNPANNARGTVYSGVQHCPQPCPRSCSLTGTQAPECGCGDGTCAADEDCSSCPDDCGGCVPYCGDGICDGPVWGESSTTCCADCGCPSCTRCDGSGCVSDGSCGGGPPCGAGTCPSGYHCCNDSYGDCCPLSTSCCMGPFGEAACCFSGLASAQCLESESQRVPAMTKPRSWPPQ